MEYLIGSYASTPAHEATHGAVEARGICYTSELRLRIERLCVREQQRFITRLIWKNPDLAGRLDHEFDAARWEWTWTASKGEKFRATMRRIFLGNR